MGMKLSRLQGNMFLGGGDFDNMLVQLIVSEYKKTSVRAAAAQLITPKTSRTFDRLMCKV